MRMRGWLRFGLVILTGSILAAPRASAEDLLPADRPVHEVIDHYVNLRLQRMEVTPASPAGDANLIRRLTLDLQGRIPTTAEAQAYVASPEDDKRSRLVDRLMDSAAFARHQANQFDAMLMAGSRGSVRDYLLRAFQENRPWDHIFHDLLLGEDEVEAQKGANQFVKSRVSDLDKLTNDTSVLFFGVNVSCAQCHDHFLVPEWTQGHYFGMKSFFNRTFDNGGFLAERDYGLVEYKTTAGESRQASLMFLTGTVIDEPPSEKPSDEELKQEKERLEEYKKNKQPPPPPSFSRRAQLVEAALQEGENEYFARAVVNRIWYRLFGYGLVMPIDQMHPENLPSHAELLQWLARDLADHDYDLRRLIQGIVLSQAYARSSYWEQDERPIQSLFAVANVRPLAPHQYATSLRLASTNPDQFAEEVPPQERQRRLEGIEGAARGLAGLFDQPEEDFQVSVTEALLLNNSERVQRELLRDAGDSLVGKLKTIEDLRERIETAIWAVFARPAEAEEVELLESFLSEHQDRPVEACQQLVWALLASSECRFNY